MSNENVEKGEKSADILEDVHSPPGNSELSSPVSRYDDPEDEIRRHEEGGEKRAEREELNRSQSYATDTSVLTRTTTRQSAPAPPRKPWYKTPNPLRWGSIPPVPGERQVSKEYQAGFFSLLTFHWMGPLMHVSNSCL